MSSQVGAALEVEAARDQSAASPWKWLHSHCKAVA